MATTEKERIVLGVTERRCSRCCGWKPLDEFYTVGHGMPSWRCKRCQLEVSAEYVAANPERRRSTARRSRFNQSLKYYGLTREGFDAMVLEQEGRCRICSQPRELQIDHDHLTRVVRGLLCGQCNKALGLLNDDASTVAAMISYLATSYDDASLCFSASDGEGHFIYGRLTTEMAEETVSALQRVLAETEAV